MSERAQIYRFIRRRVFVNRWGRERPTIDWLTNCPDCGVEFEVYTDAQFTKPVRRCRNCKQSGVRTSSRPIAQWPEGGGEGEATIASLGKPTDDQA